jgi:hypothetical protein
MAPGPRVRELDADVRRISFGNRLLSRVQLKAILAAIAESRAQAELTNLRAIGALSERVAVLEAQPP